jgi:RNA binding exosome subunit
MTMMVGVVGQERVGVVLGELEADRIHRLIKIWYDWLEEVDSDRADSPQGQHFSDNHFFPLKFCKQIRYLQITQYWKVAFVVSLKICNKECVVQNADGFQE